MLFVQYQLLLVVQVLLRLKESIQCGKMNVASSFSDYDSLLQPQSGPLLRQLSWEVESDTNPGSIFSQGSPESRGSSESINEQIEEVQSDLNDMLKEVEVLKRSSVIYDSVMDMADMIEDAGRVSRRNSAMFSDDFSLEETPMFPYEREEPRDLRDPSRALLSPYDAWRSSEKCPPRLRHSRSMEVLTLTDTSDTERVGLLYGGRQTRDTRDLEEQIREFGTADPWQAEEKVGGIAYTLKVGGGDIYNLV